MKFLTEHYHRILQERFDIAEEVTDPLKMLDMIAEKRNCYKKGQEFDLMKASSILIDEFRSGKLGRITLEFPQ